MTTTYSEEPRRSSASSSSRSRGAKVARAAGAALTPEAIMDLVGKLGLMDMVTDRIRARVQELDIDQLLDDAADYIRRNPEVLVIAMGTVTIATGAMVFLSRRDDDDSRPRRSSRDVSRDLEDDDDEPVRIRATAPASPRATARPKSRSSSSR